MKLVISGGKIVELGNAVRLFHGTDIESAKYIARFGVSQERIFEISGCDEFWMTTDSTDAAVFAGMSPIADGARGVVSFDLPYVTVETCLASESIEIHDQICVQFFPGSFSAINTDRSNVSVVEMNIDFQ